MAISIFTKIPSLCLKIWQSTKKLWTPVEPEKKKLLKMPKLTPISIPTNGQPTLVRIWRWMTDIRKWRVEEHWPYKLSDDILVVIPKEFIFDGASVPRPLWFLLSPTGLLLIPGLIHDFGYRYDYLYAIDTSKKEVIKVDERSGRLHWDNLFREVGENVNGMKVINKLASIALFLGGIKAWNTNQQKNEPELPTPTEDELESLIKDLIN